MEFAAVYHRPRSEFAHAVEEGRFVFRLRAAHGMLKGCALHCTDRAPLDPGVSFVRLPMVRVRADAYGDWYEAELRTELKRVGYCFELEAEDGIWYYYGDCFERQLPRQRYECFQFPYDHRADRLEVPAWAADAVVYNIFPDSFASGRAAICGEGTEKPWNGEMCASRLGGTVEGVRLNLGYIRDLGCNCVYLNPVFAADSYHKYDLLDYFHVDPCMGTDAQFGALVDEAHGMGLRVIIDGVFNHTSWHHPFFQDVLRRGKASPFWRYYYALPEDVRFPAKGEAPGYACFSYVPQMPKTDTSYPPLRDYFCAVGAHWVREYDVDGWRLDVANEVDDGFLRAFRRAVKGAKRDAIIIGEVWENASHYLQGDMMDSAMNYDFRRFCQRFFAEGSIGAEDFDARVSVLLMRYQRQAAFAQLNLLDSHDVSRFFSLCGGDAQRMALAVLFQMTFVGMPSVFYGDELGMDGVAELEYRRPMAWGREHPLTEVYRKMIALRNAHAALRRGSFATLRAEGGLYCYERALEGERVAVCMNPGSAPRAVEPLGEVLLADGYAAGTLEEKGYAVFLRKG